MSPVYDSDADATEGRAKARPKGKIPHAPERDASFSVLRDWLSNAIGLPPEVRVETIVRAGRDPEDPLSIVLSNQTAMRCAHQKRLQQARTLQAFLASESDGIAQAPYLSPAEVGDVYTVMCRLGTAAAKEDPGADLHERLAAFVGLGRRTRGSLAPKGRYTTIQRIRRRPQFDRHTAESIRNGHCDTPPLVLLDMADGKRYVRASEWVTYLRHVAGRTVDETRLIAQMAEIGSERIDPQAWNSDRSHKVHLVFYSLPEGLGDEVSEGDRT